MVSIVSVLKTILSDVKHSCSYPLGASICIEYICHHFPSSPCVYLLMKCNSFRQPSIKSWFLYIQKLCIFLWRTLFILQVICNFLLVIFNTPCSSLPLTLPIFIVWFSVLMHSHCPASLLWTCSFSAFYVFVMIAVIISLGVVSLFTQWFIKLAQVWWIHSLYFPWNVFIYPSFLKYSFPRYIIRGWQGFFPFKPCKMSFHSLLACKDSAELSDMNSSTL